MKKKLLTVSIFLAFMLIILLQPKVFARVSVLDEIADKFNNSNTVASLKSCGYDMQAYADDTELRISLETKDGTTIVSYELEESVLSYEHLVDDTVITAMCLADSIGQLHGYNDGEVYENINLFSDEYAEYTLEKEGLEIKPNGSYYSAKFDIEKKVPLIDINKFYLKPSEFDIIKDIISENTYGNQTSRKAKLAYDVQVHEENNEIYIGEENEITESTYKSILSALEVMYGTDAVNYFKTEYPEFEEGITSKEGFTVEYDADIDVEEYPIFTDTKVVIVTVDNAYMKDAFQRTEFIGENIDRGAKNITIDFTKNSYKLGFMESAQSSDAGFLFKYILEPVFMESGKELEDDTAYFKISNGKIVASDKNDSILKLVVGEEYLELLPTNNDCEKTTSVANHKEVIAPEYDECDYIGHLHYRNGIYNVTVNIVYGKEVENTEETKKYETLEGAGQTINTSKNNGLTFRFSIEYSKFVESGKVYIDGVLVDSSNYTVKEGSTIITFNNDFVKTLSAGNHTLKLAVADGEVSTTFAVENNTEKVANTNQKSTNPKTGDNIIIYVVIFLVSLAMIVILLVIRKKKSSKKK